MNKLRKILYGWFDNFKRQSTSFDINVHTIEKYKLSPFYDSNGVQIREGDIIIVDGYGTAPENYLDGNIHCVEYYEGCYGSDVYSDFDNIENYNNIKVVGHCEQLREKYEQKGVYGNIGTVLKKHL